MSGEDESPACIVLDVDWAPDPVLEDALDLLEEEGLAATVFVTHDTPLLERMRASPGLEVGIHPDFNDLLRGTAPSGASAETRVRALMDIVPEATSVRSHSLAHTSWLMYVFADAGLTHEVNAYLPVRSGMVLRAWRNWDDRLIRVPFCFEDSLQAAMEEGWDLDLHLRQPGLRVLNFHPVRLYLNAREVVLPDGARGAGAAALSSLRNGDDVVGSRTFLREFAGRHRDRGGTFATIRQITVEHASFAAANEGPA